MQLCSKCKRQMPSSTSTGGLCGLCLEEINIRKCPYCKNTTGFTYNRTDKVVLTVDFEGQAYDESIEETIYEHTTRRCIECDESITSYVKSLGLGI
jgi:hypothetical protein